MSDGWRARRGRAGQAERAWMHKGGRSETGVGWSGNWWEDPYDPLVESNRFIDIIVRRDKEQFYEDWLEYTEDWD